MQHIDLQVIDQGQRWLVSQPVWLCTVLCTFGSSPRPPGTMMVITADGDYCGSLSGGCIEEDFIRRIRNGDFQQPSQRVRYGDGGLTPDRTLPCGGVLDILIEHLQPSDDNAQRLAQLHGALAGHLALQKVITLPRACERLEEIVWRSSTVVEQQGDRITLTIAAPPRLIVAGLSTVALYCASFAVSLGFETIVCENRPDFLANFASQLDGAVRLEKCFPARYLEEQSCHANTAVVALTHDPRMDDLTMMEAVHTPAFYLGVMGSQRNSANRRQRLAQIGDLSAADLARIHAPIGMDIGSKTPAEIALAVMADIVKAKNRGESA